MVKHLTTATVAHLRKKKVAKYDNEKEMVKKRVEGWLRIGQDD